MNHCGDPHGAEVGLLFEDSLMRGEVDGQAGDHILSAIGVGNQTNPARHEEDSQSRSTGGRWGDRCSVDSLSEEGFVSEDRALTLTDSANITMPLAVEHPK